MINVKYPDTFGVCLAGAGIFLELKTAANHYPRITSRYAFALPGKVACGSAMRF